MQENELSIDPFKIFDIPYEFAIANLDAIYFQLYKNAMIKNDLQKQSDINNAYAILKNPIAKAHFLCKFFNHTKINIELAKNVFAIMNIPAEEKIKLRNDSFEKIISYSTNSDWANTWICLQKYSYLSRLLEN